MIVTWSAGDAGRHMDESIHEELGAILARHPWWRARAALTLGLLRRLGVEPPAAVLDAGCGGGITLEALERRGYHAAGLEISGRALEALDRPGRTLYRADLSSDLPADAPAFDAVLALDVIEHLDDDRAAVGRLGRLARPGGWVVVSVPALPELFTEYDAVQGHRRRYTPESLAAAFEGTGLALERQLFWGGWMVPILRRQRRRARASAGETAAETYRRYLALPPWPLPLGLRLGFALDHGRTLRGRNRTGTSLFALARRPA